MKNIALTVDSGLQKLTNEKATVIPCHIKNRNTLEEFLDNQEEITSEEIYQRRKNKEPLCTDGADMAIMMDVFEKLLNSHDHIIHMSMSGEISGACLNTANLIASEFPGRVSVVDSRQGGSGGLYLIELIDLMIKNGYDKKQIIGYLNEIIPNVFTRFIVKDPSGYFSSGKFDLTKIAMDMDSGRFKTKLEDLLKVGNKGIEAAAVKLTKLFRLKFEVGVVEGKLPPVGVHLYKGNIYLDHLKNYLGKIDENDISLMAVSGTILNKEYFEEVKEYLDEYKNFKKIYDEMSGVICTFACENTLGITTAKLPSEIKRLILKK